MNNQTKTLVPKLRFSEFRNAPEWEVKPIAKVCDVLNSRRMPISSDNREKGYYPYYGASGIVDYVKDFIFDERLLLVGEDGAKWGAFEKTAFIAEGMYWVNNHAHVLRTTTINDTLLENYLSMLDLTPFITGAAPPKLTLGKLKDIPIPIPPTEKEQQKIADCLSSIDELITAQTQKLDTLKTHKKGLMQQLFPAEGETVPKLRFPEFRDAGEWAIEKIETLAKRGSGHTPNKAEPSYYNGGIKWVSLADSNKLDNGYIYETKIEISNNGLKNSSAVLHPSGTVIISRDAGIGKSAIMSSEMAVSQHFIVWICDASKLFNWFLYYTLQILKPTFENIAVGSTIKTIGLPYFKELCISIPSVNEQKKIAECLASVDALIAAQVQKVEALKQHKKGLMQQLFPAADEVAG